MGAGLAFATLAAAGVWLGLALFGHGPGLEGTRVGAAARFAAGGWVPAAERVLSGVVGPGRARAACDGRLPLAQLLYLGLFSGCYAAAGAVGDQLLAESGAPADAALRAAFPLLVLAALFSNLWASFADPGTVTRENVARSVAAYTPDGVLFPLKPAHCASCDLPKPARSKHCATCDRCVSRFDHHCSWIDNCVGERNIGSFISFLALNALLCAAGAAACARLVWGDLADRGLLGARFQYARGPAFTLGESPAALAEFCLGRYPALAGVGLFLGFCGLLVGAFLLYHLRLALRNQTTNEYYKCAAATPFRRRGPAANLRAALCPPPAPAPAPPP